jgi:hypothetical protein
MSDPERGAFNQGVEAEDYGLERLLFLERILEAEIRRLGANLNKPHAPTLGNSTGMIAFVTARVLHMEMNAGDLRSIRS